MHKNFIKVNSSYELSYLNIDSIDSITLHKTDSSYVVTISGKWLSCNELYESKDEAVNRINGILNEIDNKDFRNEIQESTTL